MDLQYKRCTWNQTSRSHNQTTFMNLLVIAGPDPGFSIGGCGPILGGFWPPTWALFSENVCKNERIGSCRGACAGTPP